MISYDDFAKNCSISIEPRNGKASVLVIFSQGYVAEFGKDFVKDNEDIAKELVTHDLYDIICEQFS